MIFLIDSIRFVSKSAVAADWKFGSLLLEGVDDVASDFDNSSNSLIHEFAV
jgi:hypothetical protein